MSLPSIDIAFDFTSAASLLAYKPTCAMADELGVEVHWLPFPTEARSVPVAKTDETIGERHARVRAEYVERDFSRYADVQGLVVERDAAGVDSTTACAFCLAANRRGVGRAFVERVFKAFWANRLDIEDRGLLAAILAELGVADIDEAALDVELTELRAALADRGVFTVPTYIAAEQLFVGRQHLPMIRWLLAGGANVAAT